ncbi:MAG: GWxTD domain-containing protein [Bacteroidetes bacterium]|nr:GWxTD domain-containing protein [Bacteroidota bacterium]
MKNIPLFSLVVILALYPTNAFSRQPEVIRPVSQIGLNVDYSQFRSSENENYIEISYAIFPSQITLVKNDSLYEGGMEIQANISLSANDSIIFRYPCKFPIQLQDTSASSLGKSFLSKFTLQLTSGQYRLKIRYCDLTDRTRCDSMETELSVTAFSNAPTLSDIDVCSSIIESTQKESSFYKNTYEVFTNPSRFFGSTFTPVLYSYVELYNLIPSEEYSIITRLVNWKGAVVKEQTRKKVSPSPDIVDVSTMKMLSYPSGKYFYQMELLDKGGKSLALRQKAIYIYNPDVKTETVQPDRSHLLALSAVYNGMDEAELDKEFASTRYISRRDDEKIYSKLNTFDAKRDFLAQFWSDVESGKRGYSDVTRAVYTERVSVANQRYRQFGKEGWKTDRGRVYILYGEPSDVERYPMGDNVKPYEIWQYDSIEGGVQFVFVDRSGYGEYILVHSTKRGEVQDENWQQYLQ